jgi:hypothetical protein
MIWNFSDILGAAAFALAIAICLLATVGPGKAQDFTAEQRANCSGDAFRLCSSEIPNIPAVTACMRKNRSNLSAACKAVFPR